MSERIGQFRIGVSLVLAIVCVSASACSSDGLPVYPVRGRVLIDGKPAAGAVVVLHPLDASGELSQLRPVGRVGPDGSFSLATYDLEDGAPAGNYKVTITYLEENDFVEEPEQTDSAIDRAANEVVKVPPKYSRPETSDLMTTVTAGTNELAPFELKLLDDERQQQPQPKVQ